MNDTNAQAMNNQELNHLKKMRSAGMASLNRRIAGIKILQEAYKKLEEQGVKITSLKEPYSEWADIKIRKMDLPKVRKALGKLNYEGKGYAGTIDGEDYISVKMIPVAYPKIEFVYETPLKEGAKCKIVEYTSTNKQLVCDV